MVYPNPNPITPLQGWLVDRETFQQGADQKDNSFLTGPKPSPLLLCPTLALGLCLGCFPMWLGVGTSCLLCIGMVGGWVWAHLDMPLQVKAELGHELGHGRNKARRN